MAFTQVTVTGTYKLADGSAADGFVRFTPRVPMHNENVVVSAPVTATLNGSGAFSVSLAATDDPGTLTTDGGTATYRVELVLVGQPARSYQIVLGHVDVTRNLADIITVTPTLTAADWLTQTQADALYTSFDVTIDDIADLTPVNDDVLQFKAGTWANRTVAQLAVDLAAVDLTPSGGNDYSAVQAYLTALGDDGGGMWDLGGQTFIIRSALSVPPSVHLRNGRLTFDTDLGAGVTAVTLNGTNTTAPTLTNVEIFGPGSVFAVGTVATQMDGVRCCPQSTMLLCKVFNFRSNVLIKDNHERFFGCRFTNGYYNVYFEGGASTFGDQSFIDCDLSGARWASVAVAATNVCDTVMFSSGHTGFAPYCFYKETGTATRGFLVDAQMMGLSFEQVGNAGILDDSANPIANGSFSYSVLDSAGFTWNATYKIAARARDYAVSVGLSVGSKIRASASPFVAGDVAAYKFASGPTWLDFIHEGDPVASMFATSSAAFHGATIITSSYRATVMRASGTISAGHYLERSGTVDVRPYGSFNGTGEVGVAVNAAASSGYVIVATDGEVDALCVTTGSHGVPLVPDTAQNGRLRPVTSSGNGYPNGTAGLEPSKYPIVAEAAEGGGGGSAGGALMRVRLSVTQDRTYVRPGTVASLPSAAVAYRGQILVVEGGTGVADVASICLKNSSNAYAWLSIT